MKPIRLQIMADLLDDLAAELRAEAADAEIPTEPVEPPVEPEPEEPPTEPEPEPEEPPIEPPDEPPVDPEDPGDPGLPPVPPPPPSGSMKVIRSRSFDGPMTSRELRAAGWDDVEVVKPNPNAKYVPDPLGSSRLVLQIHTPLMAKGGVASVQNIQTLGMQDLTEILIESEMMVDTDFEGEGSGENKRWWAGLEDNNNNLFLTYRCVGKGPVYPGIKLQGSLDPRGETSKDGLVKSPVAIQRGVKYRYGIYAKANSQVTPSGQRSDGILELRIDGLVVSRLGDVNFGLWNRPGDPPSFGHVQFSNTYGGGNKPTRAFNDYLYNVVISGR